MAKSIDSKPYILLSGLIAAKIFLNYSEINNAERIINHVIGLIDEFELDYYLLYAYEELVQLYEKQRDYSNAIDIYKKRETIIKQQQSTIQIKSIADIRLRDEVISKTDEIELQIQNRALLTLMFVVFVLVVVIIQTIINRNKRKKLQIEQDLAQEKELNNIRTKFLGNVSNEIRTPLTLVMGNIQLVM